MMLYTHTTKTAALVFQHSTPRRSINRVVR